MFRIGRPVRRALAHDITSAFPLGTISMIWSAHLITSVVLDDDHGVLYQRRML